MKFAIEKTGDKIVVTTPYNAKFAKKMRDFGGSWNGFAWELNADMLENVRDRMRHYFCRDDHECETVDVELTAKDTVEYGDMFGIVLVQATGRDSGAWIPKNMTETVALLKGTIDSGGSIKYWNVVIHKGAKFLVRGVPKKAVEEEFDFSSDDFDVKIVKENAVDREALTKEKAALEARLEEINRMLEERGKENE